MLSRLVIDQANLTRTHLTCVFFLRREPFYHKLRYAKVPKFDLAAPTLGAVSGAFAAYMALSTFGSGGSDLSDLTTVVWYFGVWATNLRLTLSLFQSRAGLYAPNLATLPTVFFIEVTSSCFLSAKRRF
jgi:hypothetical protein